MNLENVESIIAEGRIQLTARLEPHQTQGEIVVVRGDPPQVSLETRALRVSAGELAVVALTVGPLTKVTALSEASLVLSGRQTNLAFEALNHARIDAANLELATATMQLEQSQVTANVTDVVTGYCAYASLLQLAGGADISGIQTPNAGRLVVLC